MSGAYDVSRIKRGMTAFGPVVTITAAMQAGLADWLGTEKWVNDDSPTGGVATRSKRRVLIRLVKNSSGITLKPKRAVRFKEGTLGCEVDGYTHQIGQGSYAIVDEFLPTGGVRNGDYFWVALRGPTLVKTSTLGTAVNVISQGSLVVADTAASSQNDTNAGRFRVYDIESPTDAASALANHNKANNALGRAQTAKTTGDTDADVLVDADYHR